MKRKNFIALSLSMTMLCVSQSIPAFAADLQGVNGKMSYLANYNTGFSNSDGGVAEIVKYNSKNQKMYIINGAVRSVDIVSLSSITSSEITELSGDIRIDVIALGSANGFSAGDITSVDVNTALDIIAIAVQAEDYKEGGSIVILDYDGNYITHFDAGVQPDMVTFTPDGNYLLSADEGEPREGYTKEGAVDPKGSVTLIDLSQGLDEASAQIIDFSEFDSQRDQLINDQVLLKKETKPSVDLEPEYIAVSENSKYAYITLQEANAIATLDIANGTFSSLQGLGFKDHNQTENSLDVLADGNAALDTQDLYGVYMPDGCATYNIDGQQYILTANEGDGREWGEDADAYSNEITGTVTGQTADFEIVAIDTSAIDGLDPAQQYLFGGRSFSIWEADTLQQVYDSGSDFEAITADLYPDYFNSSNDKTKLDSRSSKKGPEPENIAVLSVGDETYAFVALERFGGVMMYNISDPANVSYTDYINPRDFSGTDVTDSKALGPEGLCVIDAQDSPTGMPLLLVANEVSGTVYALEILTDTASAITEDTDNAEAIITNDADGAVPATEAPETGESFPILFIAAAGMLAAAIFAFKKIGGNKTRLL